MTWGEVPFDHPKEHNPDVSLTSESAWSYNASYWSVTASGFSSLLTRVPVDATEEGAQRVMLLDPSIDISARTYALYYSFSGVTTYTGSFATLTPTDGSFVVGVGNSTQVYSGSTDGTFSEVLNAPSSFASNIWFRPVASNDTYPKILLTHLSVTAHLGTQVNAGRFVKLEDVADAQGGVDFVWSVRSENASPSAYISINATDPLAITSGMSIP